MTRRTPLIAGGVAVLLLLVWYVALWRPAAAESTKAIASKAAAHVEHTTLLRQFAALVALQKTLPSEEAKLHQGQLAVPSDVSVGSIIDQINGIAVADGILWTSESHSTSATTAASAATPTTTATSSSTTIAKSPSTTTSTSAAAPSSGDSTVTLTLSVAGTYQGMTKFITDLEHRPRLIVVDSLSYSPGASNAVTVAITARAFYNPLAIPPIPKGPGGS